MSGSWYGGLMWSSSFLFILILFFARVVYDSVFVYYSVSVEVYPVEPSVIFVDPRRDDVEVFRP